MKRTRAQVLIFLAAGALLGSLAASGRFLSGPEALAGPAGGVSETGQPGEPIIITVRLPADAILQIDGSNTEPTGKVRPLRTPALPGGGHYSYTLKATSQEKEVSRKIDVAHGVDNSFDLRAEFQPAAAARPDTKRTANYGQPANGGP